MLTKAQRKRLAKEMRGLALECAAGVPVPLGAHGLFTYGKGSKVTGPACFLGHVYWRAGFRNSDEIGIGMPYSEERTLIDANDDAASVEDRRLRVVFPGLALADALEAA